MSMESGLNSPSRRPRPWILWLTISGLVLTAIGFNRWLSQTVDDDFSQSDFLRRFGGGSLVIAGGGHLPPEIRKQFLDLGGGPNKVRLVVIPSFAADEQQMASLQSTWKQLGAKDVRILHATSREQANQPDLSQQLMDASAVWLTGGQQSWLSEHYSGTIVEDRLQAVIARGGVIGGTSAGAAAMTKLMIRNGIHEANEGIGFDLLRDAVVDQHVLRRSRLNRLIGLMEAHPELTAFGIDEGTALVVQVPKGYLGVIGSSYVVACIPPVNDSGPRFVVLKHGDHVGFSGLKSGKERVNSPSEIDAALSDE